MLRRGTTVIDVAHIQQERPRLSSQGRLSVQVFVTVMTGSRT